MFNNEDKEIFDIMDKMYLKPFIVFREAWGQKNSFHKFAQ